jgi:hypothetical protein
MKLFVLFANRHYAPDAIEALACIDEYSHDENPSWMREEEARQIKDMGGDCLRTRWVRLEVPYKKLEELFSEYEDIRCSIE